MTFSIRPYLTSGNFQDKETLNQILVVENLFLHPLPRCEHVAGPAPHHELQFCQPVPAWAVLRQGLQL